MVIASRGYKGVFSLPVITRSNSNTHSHKVRVFSRSTSPSYAITSLLFHCSISLPNALTLSKNTVVASTINAAVDSPGVGTSTVTNDSNSPWVLEGENVSGVLQQDGGSCTDQADGPVLRQVWFTKNLIQQCDSLFVVSLHVNMFCWCGILVPRVEIDLGEARVLFQQVPGCQDTSCDILRK